MKNSRRTFVASLSGMLAGLIVLASIAAPRLGAQSTQNDVETGSDLLWACYVPHSGTVYRIRTSDTKEECASPQHVLFSWSSIGPHGIAGAQGPAGEAGPIGPQGPQGAKGETGAQGDAGPKGEQGDAGLAGAVGPQGPKGDTGPAGADGPQGAQGEVGPVGPAGPQGPEGPQGESGERGAHGIIGQPGARGPQGPDGEHGPIGPRGAAGGITNYQTTSTQAFLCHTNETCTVSWACPAGTRALTWGFDVTNYKAVTWFSIVGAHPTTNLDGYEVTMQNHSGVENVEWKVILWCAEGA
jgi:hypothetical protein